MIIVSDCVVNSISVLKVQRANVLFWIHSSLERKLHRLIEGPYLVMRNERRSQTISFSALVCFENGWRQDTLFTFCWEVLNVVTFV